MIALRETAAVFIHDHPDQVPPPKVPSPYKLRHYEEGDGDAWDAVIDSAFSEFARQPSDITGRRRDDPVWSSDRTWFATLDGNPVAVATACEGNWKGERVGVFGWVATHPDHRRKGLARAVCSACFQWWVAHGFKRVLVCSHRTLPRAIRMYLSMGFGPVTEEAAAAAKGVMP